MSEYDPIDVQHMRRACEAALNARGYAEPNPTVGCVIAIGDEVLAEGWTQPYGSDHAEVHAIGRVSPKERTRLADATLYVTLEPCCHHGKTPPCTQAILATPVKRIVVAMQDPFPQVAGQGIQQLRDAGCEVEVGLLKEEAKQIVAPFLKQQAESRPWLIAKWAMTLDGKIATYAGDSQWISCEASRAIVHEIRGRVDGIMVGIGTALADDPSLTARPPGPRVATRIVVDSKARLPLDSRLVKSAHEFPLLLCVGPEADNASITALRHCGVEVFVSPSAHPNDRLIDVVDELGKRRMTNILVEGGGELLGSLLDQQLVDEVHVFVAPKIVGSSQAKPPVAGKGIEKMAEAFELEYVDTSQVDNDVYMRGFIRRTAKGN